MVSHLSPKDISAILEIKKQRLKNVKISSCIQSRMGSSEDVLGQCNSRVFIENQYFEQIPYKVYNNRFQAPRSF